MSKKIVIIEDEHDLAAALQESLSQRGFVVRTASKGEEGIGIIKQDRPDIILLDLILPDMNGIDVLKALKPIRDEQNIPVIVLSNIDDPDEFKEAREYDIEEYLVKTDWRLDDVIAKIKSALN